MSCCDTKTKKKATYTDHHSCVKQESVLDNLVTSKSKKYKSKASRFNRQKANIIASNSTNNNINSINNGNNINNTSNYNNSNTNSNTNNTNNNIHKINNTTNTSNTNTNTNNNISCKSKKKELKKVEINSDDLVCLCGPFNLPEDNSRESFSLNNNRYNENVDLSVIYGSLKLDGKSINNLNYDYDYNFLNKQKLLVNFVNLIELFNDPIESDADAKSVEAPGSISNSILNSIVDSNSDSNSNSNSTSDSETDSEFQSDYEIDEIEKINNDLFVNTATLLLRDVFEHDHKDTIYSFDHEQIGIKIAK